MTHPIAPIRAAQQSRTYKSRWSAIVREAIIEALRERGEFHADDIAHLGIPEQHRNIIGSQIARLVNQGWMVEDGRRKSTHASRNGAKSNVYRLTRAGVVGVGTGASTTVAVRASDCGTEGPTTSPDPGGSDSTEAPESPALFDPAAGEEKRRSRVPSAYDPWGAFS